MSEENAAPDLIDLKFLPAWVKETPNENRYADYAGEENVAPGMRDRRGGGGGGGERRDRGPRPPRAREGAREQGSRGPRDRGDRRPSGPRPQETRRVEEPRIPMPPLEVRFVPDGRVLENVLAQIKAGHLAYSVFTLARTFLDKPERYDVRLKAESESLFQLGENGPVAVDRRLLENGAFVREKDNFYKTEVTQSEPIKGNFTAVARCRLSGVLLGPTNHHAYQPQLRALYEQRFSRRMSFPDYQRQIEIVSDPETVERWKEEARSVTTYTTLQEEPAQTFQSAAETERHFRQTYLPGLLKSSAELSLDGVVSRQLPDRSLGRVIEDAWAQEFRSPTRMMQELIGAFRQNALHIFRHRKGMLFVSPVRARPVSQDASALSTSVAAILRILGENPGINRKLLLEKLPAVGSTEPEAVEKRKLALASNLHWLIREGHVIEFNDGVLDLPRAKSAAIEKPRRRAAESPNGAGEAADAPETENVSASAPADEAATTPPPASASSAAQPSESSSPAPQPEAAEESEQPTAAGSEPAEVAASLTAAPAESQEPAEAKTEPEAEAPAVEEKASSTPD